MVSIKFTYVYKYRSVFMYEQLKHIYKYVNIYINAFNLYITNINTLRYECINSKIDIISK